MRSPIGGLVLRHALRGVARWRSAGLPGVVMRRQLGGLSHDRPAAHGAGSITVLPIATPSTRQLVQPKDAVGSHLNSRFATPGADTKWPR